MCGGVWGWVCVFGGGCVCLGVCGGGCVCVGVCGGGCVCLGVCGGVWEWVGGCVWGWVCAGLCKWHQREGGFGLPRGRFPEWYNKTYGHLCAAEVARIRDSFTVPVDK